MLALLHRRHQLGRRDRHLVDAELAQPGELAAVAAAPVLRVGEGEDVLVVERPAAGLVEPVLGDRADLAVAHEHALHADRPRQVDRLVEHVAAADEVLGARRVEHGPRVDVRGHRERDARRDVGLDQAGHDVDRRPLRGEHEVDADRARLLGDLDDRVLDLAALAHDQVGQLVDDQHDVRASARARRATSPPSRPLPSWLGR